MQIRPYSSTSDQPYSDADGGWGVILSDLQQGVKEKIPIYLPLKYRDTNNLHSNKWREQQTAYDRLYISVP